MATKFDKNAWLAFQRNGIQTSNKSEIKEDIIKLKENVEDQSILEVVNTVLEILDFI